MEEEKNRVLPGTLYLVATPIGNLADLGERARKVLSEVDFIAAEDTRHTRILLTAIGISRPTVSYHEHNKRESGERIAARLEAGESCALVTDAGTPAVSDPGGELVALCAARGIAVTAVPGCCAAVAALTLSGLPTGRFVFEGFLPVERARRTERLEELASERRTILLHEAPHRLCETLDDLIAALGADRRVALCRELTKRNEEIERTTLGEAAAHCALRAPRGEYVLVIEGGHGVPVETVGAPAGLAPAAHVAYYEHAGLSRMEAIKAAARDRGIPKNAFYRLLQEEKTAKDEK